MTVFPLGRPRPRPAFAAASVVLRAAAGLFLHGLLRPGLPATIDPASGRVRPR